MKKFDILAAILVVVGGLNWGLVALAEFDLVATLVGLEFGETNALSRIVYGLVGLAAAARSRSRLRFAGALILSRHRVAAVDAPGASPPSGSPPRRRGSVPA